ncbi:MAG: DUF2799 domain-containing protein [Bdellovibrionales bacterium]
MKLLMSKSLAVLLLGTLMMALSACQSTTKLAGCESTDWYELGRRAGTTGLPSQNSLEKRRCGRHFDPPSEAIYVNGYNNGLSEYCTPDNGYALGKAGSSLNKVCPRPIDQDFVAGYNRGKKVRELENVNQNLDRKISSLNQKLKSAKESGAKTGEHGALVSELTGLQQELQANRRRMTQIEKQVN